MDVRDIKLEDFMLDTEDVFSFSVKETKDVDEECDRIRKEKGMTDFSYDDKPCLLYYNVYVIVNTRKETVSMSFSVHNSEEDDLGWYDIPLSDIQKERLLWKVICTLSEMD